MNVELRDQQNRFERILLILFLLTLPLLNPWVRGDGVGYYAYARAPLIEHNFDFTHDYQSANESFREGRLDENGQPKADQRTRTGHLDNHFSVGPAMLWSPFLLVAHGSVLLARALGSNVSPDGFSAPYRYAMAFGTGLYGFLALVISFRLARKYVGPLWSFVATIAVWLASSLPVYIYFNPSWSHAHSAFLVALFLWYWDSTRESRSLAQWLLLGAIVGLMLDVYYANLMVVSVLVIEAVGQYAKILHAGRPAVQSFLELLTRHLLFGLVVILVMIPTFISRWIVYGGPFETGYVSIRRFSLAVSGLFQCAVFFRSRATIVDSSFGIGHSRFALLHISLAQGRNPVFHSIGGILSLHFLLPGLGGHLFLWQPLFCFFDAALHSWSCLSSRAGSGAFPQTADCPGSLLWSAGLLRALESGVHLSMGNPPGAGARSHLVPPGRLQPVLCRAQANDIRSSLVFLSAQGPDAPDRTARYQAAQERVPAVNHARAAFGSRGSGQDFWIIMCSMLRTKKDQLGGCTRIWLAAW